MPTMPAALATGLKQLQCDEIPVPDPEPGRVLVKTNLASICGSDLHICYMGWNVYKMSGHFRTVTQATRALV